MDIMTPFRLSSRVDCVCISYLDVCGASPDYEIDSFVDAEGLLEADGPIEKDHLLLSALEQQRNGAFAVYQTFLVCRQHALQLFTDLYGEQDAQQALAAARWHDQLSPNQTTVESPAPRNPGFAGFDPQTADFLASVGHNVSFVPIGSSSAQAVERFDNGVLLAAHEVRQLSARGSAF